MASRRGRRSRSIQPLRTTGRWRGSRAGRSAPPVRSSSSRLSWSWTWGARGNSIFSIDSSRCPSTWRSTSDRATRAKQNQEIQAEMFGLSGMPVRRSRLRRTLSLLAGFGFGLPSPGHVTLTRVGDPGSDFVVDSFFDVHYAINFSGRARLGAGGLPGPDAGGCRAPAGQARRVRLGLRQRQRRPSMSSTSWPCSAIGVSTPASPCDFNNDGFVDVVDFLELLANWGPCPGLHPACFPGDGNCFIENGTPACDIPFCCVIVCDADPLCCSDTWDADCVALAGQFCAVQ